jgi:hypothetical protein
LDQAGLWAASNVELRSLNVSNAEVAELAKVHDAGLSDTACIDLIRLARSRQKPFDQGQAIVDLLSAGSSEKTVVTLAHLNQLGLWTGEARAMRMAGLRDSVILASAQRRAQSLPTISGATLGDMKNAGASDAVLVEKIEKGTTEQQAKNYIVERQVASGGHNFVYQGRGRKRH